MKREQQTVYKSDKGSDLIKLTADGQAYVTVSFCKADTLDELATACAAAAEELRESSKTLDETLAS